MAQPVPAHRCRVFASPWPGVHCTVIDSERHFARHWHACHGLGLLVRGAQHSASGCGPVQAFAGDVISANPGEVHDGRPLGGGSRRWRMLYLEPQALHAALASDDAAAGLLTRPVIQDRVLAQQLLQLLDWLESWSAAPARDDVLALACDEALVTTCGQLWRHTGRRADDLADALVQRAFQRLCDDLLHAPSLDELAADAGLSKYQLLRRFKHHYGLPPHAWLLLQRAERARSLIQRGTSLADAAAASGFADQSHLSRVFVRHFGFTPGAWRRAARH